MLLIPKSGIIMRRRIRRREAAASARDAVAVL
jgi:hypothetical protein